MEKTYRVKCPHCGRQVECRTAGSPFPFCSTRCKLLDLGKWIHEEHRIESPLPDRGDGEDDQKEKNGRN